jgi:hypothetical protein
MTDKKGMLFSSFFLGDNSFHSRMPFEVWQFWSLCVWESVTDTQRHRYRDREREREGREGKVFVFSCEIFLWFFKSGNPLMKCSLLQFKILPLGFSLLKVSIVFFFLLLLMKAFCVFLKECQFSHELLYMLKCMGFTH